MIPILLTAAHHGAADVVRDLVHVVGVPVQVGDGAVVLACVEHDQVEERADGERAPDTEIVIHLDLADATERVSECSKHGYS